MKKSLFIFLLLVSLQTVITGQTPQTRPTPRSTRPEDEVVVVKTNLVQVDAVVTDKDGKQVTDLKPEDFEIFQNGEKQSITNFSYVEVTPASAASGALPEKPKSIDKHAPIVSTRLKPGQVRRTIALVVDDLGLSFESTHFVRQALKRFVDEQMQPNDLVAIVRTGGGIGALQQFSSDKRQLYAAIEKVRWNPIGRAGVGAFAPIEASLAEQIANQGGGGENAQQNAKEQRRFEKNSDNFRSQTFVVGTLGAVNYILTGMRELPGRKAVVLLSDGFPIFARDLDGNIDTNQNQLILDNLRRLTNAANRASVVINTIDARGLQVGVITAADNTGGLSFEQIQQRLTDRRNELFDTQQGLQYLATQTGGRSFINSNDIKGSVAKVLDDQAGYYLIGYQPDEKTFDPQQQKFNKLEIKVVRPELRVRYRSGFFSATETEEARAVNQSPRQKLFAALTSPFGASGIDLRLNALFNNDAKNNSFITSLIHVKGSSLTFTEETDNNKKAVFDILAYTFGDNGVPVDQVNKTYTMQVKGDAYQQILDKGFVYYLNVPVKKPGAYQLRVAVRDVQGEKVGSANQFIEVPDLKKNRLNLSSIVLQNLTAEQYRVVTKNRELTEQEKQLLGESDPQTDTALRRFKRNTILRFSFNIYNAQTGRANQPQLEAQMRIFKDGKLFYDGKPAPVITAGQPDLTHLNYSSAFSIPEKAELGDYVLQVIVTDNLAKENRNVAAQTVEYEIVN